MDHNSFPIGAKVTIAIPAENWGWGYRPFPQETEVTVTGYSWIDYGRIGTGANTPGFFTNSCWLVVTDGTKTETVSHHCLRGEQVRIPQEKIGDLPDSDFYEDDVVAFTRDHAWPKGTELVVCNIDYNSDMRTVRHYSVGPKDGGTTYADTEDLRLVSRGNVWKKYHGLPMTFPFLQEEMDFALRIAACDEMKNPRQDNMYSWNLAEIMDAIKAGEVDCFINGSIIGSLAGGRPRLVAYRLHDRDLAERARKHMLTRFTDEFVRSRSR